ncbi:DUF4231 domain-containing protein [Streptomyces sp. 5-10]|uniref:DUF4231 domain-containing protein n=1 Tax=Streptomyces sp. 5-10 TaxID=878925 RepID=UPI00168B83FB|nr:DUF4231 domain-containing protein [Streptomyces sp. 5-10]MBD3010132.1 DUF4231 domain-containing protein [Streptomyces sp. 5-10]
MEARRPLLSIEKELIQNEADLKEKQFLKRLTVIWFASSIILAIGAIAAINEFAHFDNDPKGFGRGDTNGLIGFFGLASTVGASFYWYHLRLSLSKKHTDNLKLESERKHLLAEEDRSRSVRGAFAEYRETIPLVRDEYRRSAERYRARHNRFQLTVIVGSILTSVSTTAAAEQGFWSWAAVAVSALVSISAGIISYFKFRERSLNLQQTADTIDLELQAYQLSIRRYKGMTPEEASSTFAEEVERIREEQRKKELQLEQPPEATPNARSQGNQ